MSSSDVTDWLPYAAIIIFMLWIVGDACMWWLTLKSLERRLDKLEKLNAIGEEIMQELEDGERR